MDAGASIDCSCIFVQTDVYFSQMLAGYHCHLLYMSSIPLKCILNSGNLFLKIATLAMIWG